MKTWVRITFAVFFSLVVWAVGLRTLARIATDPYSERQAVQDAYLISQGQHSFGIVSYAHYPNGPSYILLPFIRLVSENYEKLRLIPLFLSALALGYFFWSCLLCAQSKDMQIWSFVLSLGFLSQPGFYAWQGALHEHSYAMSLTIGLMALASRPKSISRGFYALFGFVAGWIGYDFVFIHLASFMAVRWTVYNRDQTTPLSTHFFATCLDGVSFFSGFLGAVSLHLIQNCFYFQSVRLAISDLIGASYVRLGLDAEKSRVDRITTPFTPFYYSLNLIIQFLFSFSRGGRLNASAGINGFTNLYTVLPILLTGIVLFVSSLKNKLPSPRSIKVGLMALAFTVCGCFLWAWVMPEHYFGHQYFIPRHLLVGVLLVGFFPLLLSDARIVESGDTPSTLKKFMKQASGWGLPGLPLAAAFVYYQCFF